jgi:hypothetical protein
LLLVAAAVVGQAVLLDRAAVVLVDYAALSRQLAVAVL